MAALWISGERTLRFFWQRRSAAPSQSRLGTVSQVEALHDNLDRFQPIPRLKAGRAANSEDGMSEPEKSTEDLLFEAMDREALRMIEQLDHGNVGEDGRDMTSTDERLKVFKAGQEWLQRRQKLRPNRGDDTPQGIEAMRELVRSEVRAAVRVPKKPPTKANGEGSALAKVAARVRQ